MAKSEAPRKIQGSCHCSNLTYDLVWPQSDAVIPVRACSCTFCQKHGGVYTSHPEAALIAKINDPSAVTRYRFGTKTADFHICQICGVVPFITSEIAKNLHAVVNVHTFENIDRRELIESAADFEGEAEPDRLARRQRTWIGNVTLF